MVQCLPRGLQVTCSILDESGSALSSALVEVYGAGDDGCCMAVWL